MVARSISGRAVLTSLAVMVPEQCLSTSSIARRFGVSRIVINANDLHFNKGLLHWQMRIIRIYRIK